MKRKINISILLSAVFLLGACSNKKTDHTDQKVAVSFTTSMKQIVTTRGATDPVPNGNYYLYVPEGSICDPMVVEYQKTNSDFTTANTPYWDDVKADAAIKGNTTFYFTNSNKNLFPEGTTEDLLWAKAQGWLSPLKFEMDHCMTQFSITLFDQTLDKSLNFSNAKVIIEKGLIRKATAFDHKTGAVTSTIEREEQTTTSRLSLIEATQANALHKHTFDMGFLPPQGVEAESKLHVTAGKYIFEIDMPTEFTDASPFKLDRNKHVNLEIILTEETLELKATLKEWEEKTEQLFEVTRVFNISNINELRDMILAVNTGYSFEGKVVRLTNDIELDGQINIGAQEHPFKGIFDGNGKKIKYLGGTAELPENLGGFFSYTDGATIQNMMLVAPIVKSDGGPVGALVDRAVNTTFFNCSIVGEGASELLVKSVNNYVGGLVGMAKEGSSITNCYTEIVIEAPDAEYVGGLVGYCDGAITHCSSKGYVNGGSFAGGMAGEVKGEITHCFSWSDVEGEGSKVGGLCGLARSDVSYSYAAGEVSGASDTGGIIGSVDFGVTVKYCFWNASGGPSDALGAGMPDSSCSSFDLGDNVKGAAMTNDLNSGGHNVWRYSDSNVLNGTYRMAIFK